MKIYLWFQAKHPQNVRYHRLDERLTKIMDMQEETKAYIEFIQTRMSLRPHSCTGDDTISMTDDRMKSIINGDQWLDVNLDLTELPYMDDKDLVKYLRLKTEKLNNISEFIIHMQRSIRAAMQRMGNVFQANMSRSSFYDDIAPKLKSYGHCPLIDAYEQTKSRHMPFNQALLQACQDQGYVSKTQRTLGLNPFLVEFVKT